MQDELIDTGGPDWKKLWDAAGMPAYDQPSLEPFQSLTVHFKNLHDREEFLALIGQPKATPTTRYIWHPPQEKQKHDYREGETQVPQNKYPIYVISKGRYDTNVTARNLDLLGIDYNLVVEPQELDQYKAAKLKGKIYPLPFSNLGQGSIPARNWCWEHSIENSAPRHWILDDNIQGFYQLNNNQKPKITYVQAKKVTTMTMKGGNTDELYKEDGRLKMAESLVAQHPTLVKITHKWGRWQHHVNYKPFRHIKLIPR